MYSTVLRLLCQYMNENQDMTIGYCNLMLGTVTLPLELGASRMCTSMSMGLVRNSSEFSTWGTKDMCHFLEKKPSKNIRPINIQFLQKLV